MSDQNQIPSREREPLAFAQLVLKSLSAPGLTRTPDMVGALAAEGSLAALVAIAEQVGRLADVAEAWQKAQEDHTSVTEWGSLEPVAVRPPRGQR